MDGARKPLPAVFAAVIAGLASLALLDWLNNRDLAQVPLFVAIVFVPLIVYLVASGSIIEISGPRGWGATFRTAARAPVQESIELQEIQVVTKGSLAQLEQVKDALVPGKPVAVSFTWGGERQSRAPRLGSGPVSEYLRTLLRIDPKLTIILIGQDGRHRASSDGLSLDGLHDMDSNFNKALTYIEEGNLSLIRNVLPLTTRYLEQTDSNGRALRIMKEDGVRSLVITDDQKRPIGVARQDDIVVNLISILAS